MTSSIYVDAGTAIHRLHPLTKLFVAFAVFVAVFSLDDPRFLWPAPAVLVGLVLLSGSGANLRALRPLILALPGGAVLLWSFFHRGGEPLFAIGPLRFTLAGVEYGLGMGLKLLTFLLVNVLLLSTTRVEELTLAFSRLGLPYRVGFALTLAFRLVPVFLESARTVLQAQELRSLGAEGNGLLDRLRRTAPVIVPVFMAALRRADRMAVALEMRGFGRPGRRSGVLELHAGLTDVLAVLLGVAAVGASIAMRLAGGGLLAT